MDNQHIQQHIQTVREALTNYPEPHWTLYDGSPESDAYHAVEENKVSWLQQSIDMLEQQQREIETLKSQVRLDDIDLPLVLGWIYMIQRNPRYQFIDAENKLIDKLIGLSPNKEQPTPIDYKARYEVIVEGLRDAIRDSESVGEVLAWMESTTGFTMLDYKCMNCEDTGWYLTDAYNNKNLSEQIRCGCQGGEVSTDVQDDR